MADLRKIILVSRIINPKVVQVWLRHFSLNLNTCKVMTLFFNLMRTEKIRMTGITLQELRFKAISS